MEMGPESTSLRGWMDLFKLGTSLHSKNTAASLPYVHLHILNQNASV